jgi:DNA-binding Lrp family transcriptional regulator
MAIDDLDRKILCLLQQNARTPFTKIAEKLSIPDTTIHFRVKKLVENGVIKGYTVLISPQSLGYNYVSLIKLRIGGHIVEDMSIKKAEQLAKRLKSDERVRFIALGQQKTMVYLILIGRNAEEVSDIIRKLKNDPDVQELIMWNISKVIKGEELLSPLIFQDVGGENCNV